MIYKQQLLQIRNVIADKHEELIAENKLLPEGDLHIVTRNGKCFYYQRFAKKGNRKKEHRYGISDNHELIFALVRKRYVEKAIAVVEKDIKLLDYAIKGFESIDENAVMKNFFNKYPQLYDGIFYNKVNAREWEECYEPPKDFYSVDLKSVSLKGVDMRSDGEIYITSRLDHFKIPHRYEANLIHPNLSGYHPDFTILRPRDNKLIYWEHFGKVNDDDYIRYNIEKVTLYIEYGITPWDNLIMTFNNKEGGFNAKLIDAMIEAWLL